MKTYTKSDSIEGYDVTLTCADPSGSIISVFVNILEKSFSLEGARAAILAHKNNQEAQPLPDLLNEQQTKATRMRLR